MKEKDNQLQTDNIIVENLGITIFSQNLFAWLTGTIIGPGLISFLKNGFNIAIAILGFVFL